MVAVLEIGIYETNYLIYFFELLLILKGFYILQLMVRNFKKLFRELRQKTQDLTPMDLAIIVRFMIQQPSESKKVLVLF